MEAVLEDVCKGIDSGDKEVAGVFYDLSKALDYSIDRGILITMLLKNKFLKIVIHYHTKLYNVIHIYVHIPCTVFTQICFRFSTFPLNDCSFLT